MHKIEDKTSHLTPYEATPRLAELLGELSFSGYSNLDAPKVLLVEGSSELKVIQQFLRLLGKAREIVLLRLRGNNMIHGSSEIELEEIKRITPDVFAFIDSEKTTDTDPLPPDPFSSELCRAAQIECHVLEKSIENYFPDDAIKRGLGQSTVTSTL